MSQLHVRDGISTVQPPLSQAIGYVVVVVIGVIIALGRYDCVLYLEDILTFTVMMLITKVLKKTTGEDNEKTEMYLFPLNRISIQLIDPGS
jgi:hypothetical protein